MAIRLAADDPRTVGLRTDRQRRSRPFLYGRVVWEMMAAYWPTADPVSTDPHSLRFAPIWRAMRKVVVSTTLERAEWGAEVIGKNLVEDVTALKNEPGKDILLTVAPNSRTHSPNSD